MIQKFRHKKWKNIIKKSGLFDTKYYLFKYPDVRLSDIDPILHYIKFGVKEGRNPSAKFNTYFYLQKNKDVKDNGINPLVHYLTYGKKENRETLPGKSNIQEKNFNHEFKIIYEILKKKGENIADFDKNCKAAVFEYLKDSTSKHINIPKVFSSDLYLELYPDLNKINPLVHYLNHGIKEGRIGSLELSDYIKKGKTIFESNKETIAIVHHESSATGAPLLGLNIAKNLSQKYNIVNIIMKESNLHNIFSNDAVLVIENLVSTNTFVLKQIFEQIITNYKIKCFICNSIVTSPILVAANELNIATICLIHEFAEYTRPKTKILNTLLAANKVIIPAKIIMDSILKQLNHVAGIKKPPQNISIRPQGKLPFLPDSYGVKDSPEQILKKFKIKNKKDCKIIVAAGFVHIRKGVDLFLYTAKYIKNYYPNKCKFVWVGNGFNPDEDFAYSLWLSSEIDKLGLKNDFIFLEHQENLDAIFEIADIFCLTSRMDPFPNVVIDALEKNLPIACFRDTSGVVEFLEKNNFECIIADFLDMHQMGKKIADYLQTDGAPHIFNSDLAREYLNFSEYVQFIEQTITQAIEDQENTLKIFDTISGSCFFDFEFASYKKNKHEAVDEYIRVHKKGLDAIAHNNPLPGFSNLKWKLKHTDSIIPIYDALRKKEKITTHNCEILPLEKVNDINFNYAVHLHLYYIDLAEEFNEYFQNLPQGFDLFITIIDHEETNYIKTKFKNCGASNIDVTVVQNIGRDSGPLLFDLKDKILNNKYEVIGHFHSKKSVSTNNDMGNNWRKYLLENLIGDKNISKSLLSLFNDKKTGLVFAEDRHYMDIGKNKKYINELCKMMNIPYINETPLFPLGNMFWARVDAIKQLFYLDKNRILQPEPIPYDGSYMHAIERITPSLIENNQFKYITTYKKGTKW
jgi:hypothetical protein